MAEAEVPTASLPQQNQTLAISAVCVDVRELLRRAAAAANGDSTQFLERPTQPDGMCVASSAARLPPVKEAQSATTFYANGMAASTFWAQGGTGNGAAAAGGPPPLSPADPTVLHAILSHPRPVAATDGDGEAFRAAGTAATQRVGWPSRAPPSSRLHRSHEKERQTPSALSRQARASRRAPRYTGQVHPHNGKAASHVPSCPGERWSPISGEEAYATTAAERSLPAFFATPTAADKSNDVADLSPVAQQALNKVLKKLHSHAVLLPGDTAQPEGEVEERNCAAASTYHAGPEVPPPLPSPGLRYWSTAALTTTIANQKAVTRPHIAAPLLSQGTKKVVRGAAHHFSTGDLIQRRSPPLPQSALTDGDTPNARHHALPSFSLGRTKTASVGRAQWQGGARFLREVSPLPRRTIPTPFRRQLQYAEAAPTTRRPKRK
jgi:hypothetical protein